MKKGLPVFLTAIILCLTLQGIIHAAAASGTKPRKLGQKTILADCIRGKDFSDKEYNTISALLRKGISAIEACALDERGYRTASIARSGEIPPQETMSRLCADTGNDRIIYGTLTKRFITLEMEKTRFRDYSRLRPTYTMTVHLYDAAAGRDVLTVTETDADPVKLTERVCAALKGSFDWTYITPVTPDPRPVPPPPAVGLDIPVPVVGHIVPGVPSPFFGLLLSGGLYIPRGAFSDLASAGFGFSLQAGIRNWLYNNSQFMVETGMIWYMVRKDVKSLQTFPLLLSAGHVFAPRPWIEIIPRLQAGLLIHRLVDDANNGFFADPAIGARLDLYFPVWRSVHLYLSPGYVLFFEKSSTGRMPDIQAGVRYML